MFPNLNDPLYLLPSRTKVSPSIASLRTQSSSVSFKKPAASDPIAQGTGALCKSGAGHETRFPRIKSSSRVENGNSEEPRQNACSHFQNRCERTQELGIHNAFHAGVHRARAADGCAAARSVATAARHRGSSQSTCGAGEEKCLRARDALAYHQ